MAGMMGGYDRRRDDWQFQARTAEIEIENTDKQLEGAQVRLALAEKELALHELQIEQSEEARTFLEDGKFTNKDLYRRMTSELSKLYFQSYQMAFRMARKAEKAMRYELGVDEDKTAYHIQADYWDSLNKGLLSGDKLYHDLKKLDEAYTDNNKREYELTKQVSLALMDPVQLLKLRETGKCEFDIPEMLYDMDYPGQYYRRIKSVSLTIPCVAGPFTTVSAKLTLLKDRIRKTPISGGDYAYTGYEDNRFIHNNVGIESVATSTGQGDSGLFQLDFNDPRYLPFEYAGAVSSWRVELPNTLDMGGVEEYRPFDYDTISDVILTVNYMSREGGDILKKDAATNLATNINKLLDERASSEDGLLRAFSMKSEFPSELHQFLNATGSSQAVSIPVMQGHFPLVFKGKSLELMGVEIFLKLADGAVLPTAALSGNLFTLGNPAAVGSASATALDSGMNRLLKTTITGVSNGTSVLGDWTLTTQGSVTGLDSSVYASDKLLADAVDDILIVFNYQKA
jgi:hypothetical protein